MHRPETGFVPKKRAALSVVLIALALAMSACSGGGSGVLEKLPGIGPKEEKAPKKDVKKSLREEPIKPVTDVNQRALLLAELKGLRSQLEQRTPEFEGDLAAAKAELARRQAAGEIDPEKVRLTPANIRDSQASQLDELKAELERRRLSGKTREQIIATALTENESVYRNVDTCLNRPKGDFRGLFEGRTDLTKLTAEKDGEVYQNADRSQLVLTSKTTCDISFTNDNLDDYITGLTHVLETQGAIVESKKLVGITVLTAVHPRGNFRLTSGRKVIGQGGNTNVYTSVTAI